LKERVAFIFKVDLEDESDTFLRNVENHHPATHRRIPRDLNPRLHRDEKPLNTRVLVLSIKPYYKVLMRFSRQQVRRSRLSCVCGTVYFLTKVSTIQRTATVRPSKTLLPIWNIF
jgi:hypothetical protein